MFLILYQQIRALLRTLKWQRLLALGIGPGDEVICPAWTFIATASAILMCGAKPVFADIGLGTFNIDPQNILDKITGNTRAIIVVHIAGIPCNMGAVMRVANQYNIPVIEDACQALGSEYDNKKVGTIGNIGVFSFYPSKIITTGEGGMIVTNDFDVFDSSRLIRNHGQTGRYYSIRLGYNYRMTEIQGAIGSIELDDIDKKIRYRNSLAEWFKKDKHSNCTTPVIPTKAKVAYSYYPVWEKEGTFFRDWYTPLYRMPIFEGEPLHNTEHAFRRAHTFPLR